MRQFKGVIAKARRAAGILIPSLRNAPGRWMQLLCLLIGASFTGSKNLVLTNKI